MKKRSKPKIGDRITSKGKLMEVCQLLDHGICACIVLDGQVLTRSPKFVGDDWSFAK